MEPLKKRILQDVWFCKELQEIVDKKYQTLLINEATVEQLENTEGILSVLHAPLNSDIFDKMPRLKTVSNFGAGYDHVDVAAAEERGICCGHTPGAVANATAEMGLALMLAGARRVVAGNRRAREQNFNPWWFGKTLHGATLGIIGMGDIGSRLARKAAGAFDMKVQYFGTKRKSPEQEAAIPGIAKYCESLLELCATSDVIVVSVALNKNTTNLIGRQHFAAMKKDALFVNIARGAVVNTTAIFEALRDGLIGCAALDVTDPEPLPKGHPLLNIDDTRLILTPHTGTACFSARLQMLTIAMANLEAGLNGEILPHRAT